MEITRIEPTILPSRNTGTWLVQTPIASPLSWDPAFHARRDAWMALQETVVIRVETDAGLVGWGQTRGGEATVAVITQHLSKLLLHQDPRAHGVLWDRMVRATWPYGRGGIVSHAVSALDMALWDITAKAVHLPLHTLIGGMAHPRIPVYVTANDWALTDGVRFAGYKLAMPFGPSDGTTGMEQNARLVAEMREHIGRGASLMIDSFAGWDTRYLESMAKKLEPFDVAWFEDPLPPHPLENYEHVRRMLPRIALALGNFEFGPEAVISLMQRGLVDVLQPDITWAGGITGALRILAWAQHLGIPVLWHNAASQPWALHIMAATPGPPAAAELVLTAPYHSLRESLQLDIVDGRVAVPTDPGIGGSGLE